MMTYLLNTFSQRCHNSSEFCPQHTHGTCDTIGNFIFRQTISINTVGLKNHRDFNSIFVDNSEDHSVGVRLQIKNQMLHKTIGFDFL